MHSDSFDIIYIYLSKLNIFITLFVLNNGIKLYFERLHILSVSNDI